MREEIFWQNCTSLVALVGMGVVMAVLVMAF
jgi:hypothetical protein